MEVSYVSKDEALGSARYAGEIRRFLSPTRRLRTVEERLGALEGSLRNADVDLAMSRPSRARSPVPLISFGARCWLSGLFLAMQCTYLALQCTVGDRKSVV